MALTPRQAQFVAEYVKDGNATQAAIRAGYAEGSAAVTGSQLLRHPKVAAELHNVQSKAIQRAQVTLATEAAIASAQWIIEKSVEVVNAGLAASPVRDREGKVILVETQDGEMVPAGWDAFNLAAANGALKLLSQRYPGEFSPESGTGDGARHLHLHGLTDEQLKALASGIGS